MAATWGLYLLRYGEVGIKTAAVRRRFERRLAANLQSHFVRANAPCTVRRTRGRMFLETPDDALARHAIAHTFGIVSGSRALRTDATLEAVTGLIAEQAASLVAPGASFAVRARRSGQHAFSSVDVGRECGAAVQRMVPDASVDLDAPDVEVHVEVRDRDAYLMTDHVRGPGGLPMGAQGRVVVPVLGPRSLAVAWLLMRRGARVDTVVPPAAADAIQALAPWAPTVRYQLLAHSVARNTLVSVAEALARRVKARAVATELAPGEIPVDRASLHPLAGLPEARWPDGARSVFELARKTADGPYTDVQATSDARELLAGARREVL